MLMLLYMQQTRVLGSWLGQLLQLWQNTFLDMPLLAMKVQAVIQGTYFAQLCKFPCFIIETNCQQLGDGVKTLATNFSTVRDFIKAICSFLITNLSLLNVLYICRRINVIAHKLAQMSVRMLANPVWLHDILPN